MKKKAICFTSSFDRAYAIASVMLDIKRYCPDLVDEVIILHNGINIKDQAILNQILPTKFIEYKFPIKDLSRFSSTITSYFTTVVFAKFESFRLLKDYRCVIVLDYDILIRDELSELKKVPLTGMMTTNRTGKRKSFFNQPVPNYDMEQESCIGSIWVLWDHLPSYEKICEWCYKKTEEIAEYLYLPETGIISLALEQFKIKPDQSLDSNLYDCHPNNLEYSQIAKILHCYGQPKFWNGLYCEQWEENYKTWINLGGTPCFERTYQYKLTELSKKIYRKFKSFLSKESKSNVN